MKLQRMVVPNPLTDTFQSDPVPQTLYLNASRLIRLDLFVTGPSSGFKIQLFAGDRLLTGGLGGLTDYIPYPYNSDVKAPPGYRVASHRMHSELDVIPAGEALRMVIIHPDPIQYGLAEPHRSVLRLPVYDSVEQLFRRGDLSLAPDSTGTGSGSSSEGFEDGIGQIGLVPFILGPVGVVAMRVRRRVILSFLCGIVLLGLSGCVGSTSEQDAPSSDEIGNQGRATSIMVDDEDLAKAGLRGGIFGTIQDEGAIPIEGVHIALVGFTNFTRSDPQGQFGFRNLSTGTFTLAFSKDGYRGFQHTERVDGGKITRLDVVLVSTAAKDFQRHRHDDWEGRLSKEILDRDLGIYPGGSFGGLVSLASDCDPTWFALRQCVALTQWILEPPNLVLPGTRQVDVTITWPDSTELKEVMLAFRDNSDPAPAGCCASPNWTYLYPRGSGETFHPMVAWEMTDVGHQRFSTWQFWIQAVPESQSYGSPYYGRTTPDGPFHVKMEIHKGVVPLEPPHREFWNENATLVLLDAVLSSEQSAAYDWVLRDLVPPDAVWLELVYRQEYETQREFVIQYKPANVFRQPHEYTGFQKMTPAKRTPTQVDYQYELKPGEADGYYQKRTNWEFLLGTEESNPYLNAIDGALDTVDRSLRNPTKPTPLPTMGQWLTVIAHRDAVP